MFPIRDDVPSRCFPSMTVALIVSNMVIFFWEATLDRPGLVALFRTLGFVPYKITAYASGSDLPGPSAFVPMVSAIFLHGGWMHVISNMWYLWIFGDNVEDRLGHAKFLFFYLFCGVIGNLAHYVFNALSQVPAVGASGAVAGVMGAYLVSYPSARITILIPIFLFIHFIELPAMLVIGVWFLLQLLQGVGSLTALAVTAGVAWWAHVGGFISGILLFNLFRPRPRVYRRIRRDYLELD